MKSRVLPVLRTSVILLLIILAAPGCGGGFPRNVPDALIQLGSKDEKARYRAASVLGNLARFDGDSNNQSKAVEALKKALNDQDVEVRSAAAGSLGLIGSPAKKALPDLARCLQDDDESVRINSAGAIYPIAVGSRENIPQEDRKKVVKALLETLRDKAPFARVHAIHALIVLAPDDEKVTKSIAAMLSDPNANVRYQSLEALQSIGPKAKPYADAIKRLLDDDWPPVAERAKAVLDSIEKK